MTFGVYGFNMMKLVMFFPCSAPVNEPSRARREALETEVGGMASESVIDADGVVSSKLFLARGPCQESRSRVFYETVG